MQERIEIKNEEKKNTKNAQFVNSKNVFFLKTKTKIDRCPFNALCKKCLIPKIKSWFGI